MNNNKPKINEFFNSLNKILLVWIKKISNYFSVPLSVLSKTKKTTLYQETFNREVKLQTFHINRLRTGPYYASVSQSLDLGII